MDPWTFLAWQDYYELASWCGQLSAVTLMRLALLCGDAHTVISEASVDVTVPDSDDAYSGPVQCFCEPMYLYNSMVSVILFT